MSIEKTMEGLLRNTEVKKISDENIGSFLNDEIKKPKDKRSFISVKERSTNIEHQIVKLDGKTTDKTSGPEKIIYIFTQGNYILKIPESDIEYIETQENIDLRK